MQRRPALLSQESPLKERCHPPRPPSRESLIPSTSSLSGCLTSTCLLTMIRRSLPQSGWSVGSSSPYFPKCFASWALVLPSECWEGNSSSLWSPGWISSPRRSLTLPHNYSHCQHLGSLGMYSWPERVPDAVFMRAAAKVTPVVHGMSKKA